MILETQNLVNQIGLVFGAAASVCLAFSTKIGTISKSGDVIFDGLDPMTDPEINLGLVRRSHTRKKYLSPIGWLLFTASFLLQLAATVF